MNLSASDRRRKAVWKGLVSGCGSGGWRVSHFSERMHRVSACSTFPPEPSLQSQCVSVVCMCMLVSCYVEWVHQCLCFIYIFYSSMVRWGLHVFVKQILEPLAGIKSLFFSLLHSRESCVIVEFFLFVLFVLFQGSSRIITHNTGTSLMRSKGWNCFYLQSADRW